MRSGRLAADALQRSGVGPLLRRGPGGWRGVLVLNYHRIVPAEGLRFDRGVWSAAPEAFAAQLDILARSCEVVPAREAAAPLGRRGRRVALTFDDGYRDNHDIALPLLRERDMPATFFVTSGFVDRTDVAWWDDIAWLVAGDGPRSAEDECAIRSQLDIAVRLSPAARDRQCEELAARAGRARLVPDATDGDWMTWDMVRALRAAGMDVGAHTVSHPVLATVDAAGQRHEIAASIRRIEEELGERPRLFAYPSGHRESFDTTTRDCVRELGVETAFSFYGRRRGAAAGSDALDVPRVAIGAGLDLVSFSARLTLPRMFPRARAA